MDLERFVGWVCLHQAYDAKLEGARADLLDLRADGLVIAEGEKAFVDDLCMLIDSVRSELVKVQQALRLADEASPQQTASQAQRSELEEALLRIKGALDDPRWLLLDEVLEEIAEKRRLQAKNIQEIDNSLRAVAAALMQLGSLLTEANRFNAATARELEYRARLNRLYERASSALASKSAAAYADCDRLIAETKKLDLDALLRSVREKTDHAKRIRKRADLLVLQSPGSRRNRLHYEALLRTASEPGVHGISLHAASTLVRQDRDEILRRMRKITDLIHAGLLRQSTRGSAAPDGARVSDARDFDAPSPSSSVGVEGSDAPKDPVEHLRDTGELLYRILLPDPVQQYLEHADCSLSLTTNDLELPWELMHDGTDHLCIRRPVARMPMGTYLPRERIDERKDDKIQFLLVHPSEDLGGAAQEVVKIKEALKALDAKLEVEELGPKEATGQALNLRLASGKYHVIHFAGHAHFEPKDPDQSGLLLAKGEVFLAQKARRLLRGRPLVFLNACESATTRTADKRAGAASKTYLQAPTEGLASAFVYGGALGCVGSIWPVYDDGAAFLATELYKELLGGTMIGEAMRVARERTRKAFSSQVTWAAFVLYGDPTFQLLQPF